MRDIEKLDRLQELSVDTLITYLQEKDQDMKKEMREDVRVAQNSLSAIGKIKGTYRVGDATQYSILKDLAVDRADLARNVGMMLPHLAPKKLLKKAG